ncbi:MAG: chromosomal replication initiator protein DnaA, partial [Firmicutes bacterium]|nr:chromosomal replication initiator protein DnaA [Bacillota bacterium]
MDIKKIWEDSKKHITDKVSQVSFDLWIRTLAPEAFENGVFILAAPTTMGKTQGMNDRHFIHIDAAIKAVAPIVESVQIIDAVEQEARHKVTTEIHEIHEIKIKAGRRNADLRVNANQTFDNFIIGKSNQIVAAAAEAVAKKPGKVVNPLFIHGGTGLGKTHLLNAIVNHLLIQTPEPKIVLVTSEKFTNDFVNTMMNSKTNPVATFREKYREADVLLIDDIQFIRDKKGTQEEFFHTFNELINGGKQVVLTSDRHPDEMATLEDRMRSRFKSGLIQDISKPDVEMWMAILQKKATAENYRLSDEICEYLAKIAHEKDMNVREMEGNLTKINFYATLRGRSEPDIDDCNAAMKEIQDNTRYRTTAETIIGH